MDVIAGLLDGPRARRAFLLRSVLVSPWSIRVLDEAPLALVAVVRGHTWVLPDNYAAVRISKGDVVVLRGPDHYTVADQPNTPPQALIHSDESCTSLDGGELDLAAGHRRPHLGQCIIRRAARSNSAHGHLSCAWRGQPAAARSSTAGRPCLLRRHRSDADRRPRYGDGQRSTRPAGGP